MTTLLRLAAAGVLTALAALWAGAAALCLLLADWSGALGAAGLLFATGGFVILAWPRR